MAFRWFRQNKELTRWLYIGVTVFVMVTFTVTGAMIRGLSDESDELVVGSFTLPSGEAVEVNAPTYRRHATRLARIFPNRRDEKDIWKFLMLDALARDAGIVVGDDLLASALRSMLTAAGIQSDEQYRNLLRNLSLSAHEFEETMRAELRVELYQQLASDPPRVLSERVYERFRVDHEKFLVDEVSFADAAEADALADVVPDDETLERFYRDEMNPVLRENDFSTPEKVVLDVAVLDPEAAEVAALEAALPEDQRTVSEDELQSVYQRERDRFRRPEKGAEEADGDGGTGEGAEPPAGANEEESDAGGGDADEKSDKEADEDEYLPLEEVKDRLRREILAYRVVNAAVGEYRTLDADRAAREGGENEEGTAASEGEPDPLDTVAQKYGLEVVRHEDPLTPEEIEALPRIGCARLRSIVRFLQEGTVHAFQPSGDVGVPALLRVRKKVKPQPLPFAEVRERLLPAWRDAQARRRSEEKAKAFFDALRAAARQRVEEDVARIEQETEKAIAARMEKEEPADDAAREKIRSEEEAQAKPRIDALIEPHLGEVFEGVAEEQGLSIDRIDWFRKSYHETLFWEDDPDGAVKFLQGYAPLFEVSAGGVLGPIRDEEDGLFVVARVTDRAYPDVAEMRLKDRNDAEVRVRQEVDPNWFLRQFARMQPGRVEDPEFSYDALAQRLGLRLKDRKKDEAPEN